MKETELTFTSLSNNLEKLQWKQKYKFYNLNLPLEKIVHIKTFVQNNWISISKMYAALSNFQVHHPTIFFSVFPFFLVSDFFFWCFFFLFFFVSFLFCLIFFYFVREAFSVFLLIFLSKLKLSTGILISHTTACSNLLKYIFIKYWHQNGFDI